MTSNSADSSPTSVDAVRAARCILHGSEWEVGPFNKGIVIGADNKFISRSGQTLLASGYRFNYGQSEGRRGPWVNVKDKFLGLKLNVNGQTHFGWAELSVPVGGNGGFVVSAHLEGYAYNTVAGQSILAVRPAALPNPAPSACWRWDRWGWDSGDGERLEIPSRTQRSSVRFPADVPNPQPAPSHRRRPAARKRGRPTIRIVLHPRQAVARLG
jgi:hypothetical protein